MGWATRLADGAGGVGLGRAKGRATALFAGRGLGGWGGAPALEGDFLLGWRESLRCSDKTRGTGKSGRPNDGLGRG